MKKQLLTLALCISTSCLIDANAQKSATGYAHQSIDGVTFFGISDNGLWAVGNCQNSDGEEKNPTLWNLTNNELTVLAPNEDFIGCLKDISDNGIAVGRMNGDFFSGIPAYYKEGEWYALPLPAEYNAGCVTSVTPDGRVMVGFVVKYPGGGMTGFETVPAKWTDGAIEIFDVPTNKYGDKNMNDKFTHVSSDGNKMAGHLSFSILPDVTPFYYENGEWTHIGSDIYNRYDDMSVLEIMNTSHDMKWVTGHIEYDTYHESDQWDGQWSIFRHFVYNTETKDLILDLESGPSGMGVAITNEGVQFIGCPHNYPWRQSYLKIPGEDEYQSMTQYINDAYNYDVTDLGYTEFGTVMGSSEDGKTLIGFYSPGNNWCLHLSEPIQAEETDAIRTTNVKQANMNAFVYGKRLIVNGDVEKVQISTPSGHLIKDVNYSGESIDISSLEKGVYIIALINKDKQNANSKIIIR